ncbi:NAD(P)/FAD-dependent oxidoreductase [Flavihumibacter petaseus]|uniref:Oxidoreductase n=1 Tax=Flavihumibacter petaseus NBRC 106054 TaxID=1220578 RepID=A0A0E9N3B7_9BACT|nr:FAD-dependent oxidoreductase [Flavihumibacter petaseus]GAO44452.1 oxidoreductase [Flavihumibacter petaseus NBRC 106054]
MRAIVIGGGIVGLSSAWFLQTSGWQVTVVDRNDFGDNCSYGNAGYVCPSHFIPLATPGIIRQGLKWMWNSESPFYVEPRLSWPLLRWAWLFAKNATAERVTAAAVPLRDIALFSQQTYHEWSSLPGMEMAYEKKGLLEYFQTSEKEAHAHHVREDALRLGIRAEMLTREAVQAMEPQTTLNIKGALYFPDDAHLYPNKLMHSLRSALAGLGVTFKGNEIVKGFSMDQQQIRQVVTTRHRYDAEAVVLAAGAWSSDLVRQLGLSLPMVGGRGYSLTLENSSNNLNHPAVLMEGRVALTPMDGNKIRFGGTMEITNTTRAPRMKRVKGIIHAVERYLPDFQIPFPAPDKIWYGFRPCSADGLPYIGRSSKARNLVIATGHAMIGLSLGAGTGRLVSELLNEQQPSVNLRPYDPERFG